ncbi:TldD/PmbA family protein [Clostridium bornimense]|uniref:TldD/PmbA family protein n=1 Tax=Clostridium bornimense TaxID=1216932 RepID=UPI001C128F03|nr:TldD/PmbA family protein [Clostridium bornimense]MBU5317181.1 TldD/PmbA family protein [Clostridium bornimense]
MYNFPKGFYTDIRIETIYSTKIVLDNYKLKQNNSKTETGAIIRLFDGNRWYYSSTTEIENIQSEIDSLSQMAKVNDDIENNPIVKKLEINKGSYLKYKDCNISKVSNKDKINILNSYVPTLKNFKEIQNCKLYYLDNHTEKHIISSKGTDVIFDIQTCSICPRYTVNVKNEPFNGGTDISGTTFTELFNKEYLIVNEIKKDIDYISNATAVTPGNYTCILSPVATGVFAHESFGHKSESDFMVGDETMKKEWVLGKKVGANILNIIDTGSIEGAGYVPFDDEGTKCQKNYIIKDGILTGRLHSSTTATILEEELTGNARALNFLYEPLVRMTTTFIDKGSETKESLFKKIKEGIFIDTIRHGSGMTTFTIAPARAYMIRDGKISEPVKISVITGNVMSTLNKIDGISDKVELFSFALGGCGKMEQYPLKVGLGGPYIRVNEINVQ